MKKFSFIFLATILLICTSLAFAGLSSTNSTTKTNSADQAVQKVKIEKVDNSSNGPAAINNQKDKAAKQSNMVKGIQQLVASNPAGNINMITGNNGNHSGYVPNPQDVLLTEGFEGGALPAGWTDTPGGADAWTYGNGTDFGPGAPYDGAFSAYYNIYDIPAGQYSALTTPSMDFSAHSQTYLLSYWSWHSSGTDSAVIYLNEGGVRTARLHLLPTTSVWTQNSVIFSSASADGKIEFVGYSNYGIYNLYIDDIQVADAPSVGRCCYGDPHAPTCVENSSTACDGLGGTWAPGLTCAGDPCVATPANDQCFEAEAITGPYPQTVTGTNIGATVDCPGVLNWNAVWYTIDLPYASNELSIDFCPTLTDVGLASVGIVYYNACDDCSGYVIMGYAFPTCPSGLVNPVLTAGSIPGPATIYFPAYCSEPRDFGMIVDVTETPAPPPNDNCGDVTPVDLLVGSPVQFTGTNLGATVDCSGLGYPEAWEAINTYECMNLTIDYCGTPSVFGNVFVVIEDQCPCGTYLRANSWDATTCPDGNFTLQWLNVPAGTYYLPILTDVGSQGDYVMNVSGVVCPPAPANDNCADAEDIGEVVDQPWSTLSATFDGAGACITAPNIWYLYTAPANADITVSLCGSTLDTKLAVYDGSTCPEAPVAPTPVPLQGGEDVATAVPIPDPLPASYSGSTAAALDNYVPSCGGTGLAPDVVYSYAPPSDQIVNVDLCGSLYDTRLVIYEDAEGNEVGCNDDHCGLQSGIDAVTMLAGHTYYIVVDGYGTNSGDYTLTMLAAAYTIIECNDDFCGLQSQITFPATAGHQYLIEVGGYGTTIGDGVITISVPLAHDATVSGIVSPRAGQLMDGVTPVSITATVKNNGMNTETFDVRASDNHSFASLYTGLTLIGGEEQTITFPNTYLPTFTCQPYTFTVTAQLAGDLDPSNDTQSFDFAVARTADETFQNDDDAVANGWYFYAAEDLIAIQYTADADKELDYVSARTYVDELGIVWPDATIDPYKLYVFLDEDLDGIPDAAPVAEATVMPTGVSPSVTFGVLNCGVAVTTGQNFWVAFGQVEDAPAHGSEGLAQDATTDFPLAKWYLLSGVWTQGEQYAGDEMLRAYALTPSAGGCHYTVGDVNNNGAFNGIDVTYGVSYFKGGNVPPYSCECGSSTWFVAGDVNASCVFNGIDITYMVSYFKGGPAPHPCPTCPPTMITAVPAIPVETGNNQ